MIYAVLKENEEYNATLFDSFEEFTAALIERDNVNLECAIELSAPKGNTYQEKKPISSQRLLSTQTIPQEDYTKANAQISRTILSITEVNMDYLQTFTKTLYVKEAT